jgi:hypothetical protein
MKMRIAISLIFHGSVPIQPTNKLAVARSMDFSNPPVDRVLRRPSFLSEESSFAFGSDLLSTQ